jgi:predicted DNA binding CopG/RHH family protein
MNAAMDCRPDEAPSEVSEKERRALSVERLEARLNIMLPVAVHARVKIRATEQGQTIRSYILSLLQKDGLSIDP